ncbi:hypothetical protein ACFSTF_03505 [Terrilactibacillus laevilacticus]|uniref:Uncharacterized protein n=1 Tax=Terrilactibacillus laevilacticus TaxID=1380157 RepID=A0ABW5PLY9_9BACI
MKAGTSSVKFLITERHLFSSLDIKVKIMRASQNDRKILLMKDNNVFIRLGKQ